MGDARPMKDGPPAATRRADGCPDDCEVCRALQTSALRALSALDATALTDERVAHGAGYETPILHEHLGSAQACLLAAHHRCSTRIVAQWRESFAAAGTWQEGLRRSVQIMLLGFSVDFATCHLITQATRRVEALRLADIEMRDALVAVLACEHHRRGLPDLPDLQFELMLGAILSEVADEVAGGRGDLLPGLDDRLLARAGAFAPLLA